VSLSCDGNTAIVGGLAGDAAWVFTRSNGVWTQQGPKLVGIGAIGSAQQGSSVSLSGDRNTAIVGGFNDNGGLGATWVFTRSQEVWSQQGPKLVGTGAIGSARQGSSVSLSGDGNTAIVGGWGDDPSPPLNPVGAAWVFTRSNGVWGQLQAKLVGTRAKGNALQGYSVSLSDDGNYAMLGGPSDNATSKVATPPAPLGSSSNSPGRLERRPALPRVYSNAGLPLSPPARRNIRVIEWPTPQMHLNRFSITQIVHWPVATPCFVTLGAPGRRFDHHL